ncbi:MAG: pyrroline-5-carboxylate reductase [Candidatus Altiarchaeota archaeon]
MKVGVIGAGRMGSALIKGFMRAGIAGGDGIYASDEDEDRLRTLGSVRTSTSNAEVARESDIIFLAVKPDKVKKVLEEIKKDAKGKLLVSIAAGIKTSQIEKTVDARVIRVMPNTPAIVEAGAAAYCRGKKATDDDAETVEQFLSSLGIAMEVEESMMDAVTGLSGSGPAYVYLIIKALAEAGVEEGLKEDVALKLAAQTAKGAGEMVLKTGKRPQELIDMVCSPGGTTIEGLKVLESGKAAESFKKAVKAAAKRSRELGG